MGKSLAITLKKLRESRGYSIKKLAELAGVGNGTIGEIERARNSTKLVTLEKIAKALKLTKQEKEELFSCVIGYEPGMHELILESKKTLKQYDDFISEASLFFNDEKISEEDKKKLVDSLNEIFYDAKLRSKR